MASLKGLEGGVGPTEADFDAGVAPGHAAWLALRTFSARSFIFALVLGVLAAAGGAAVAMRRPAVYASSASLLIDQPRLVEIASDQGPIQKLSNLRAKYLGLANTPAIAAPAAERIGLSEGQVAGSVTVSAPPISLLLVTTAQSGSPTTARRIANAVAQSIVDYTDNEQGQIDVPPADRYRFTVVQPAVFASKIQPTTSRALQAAAALGAVALVLAYVIVQLLTAEVRTR